MWETRSVFQAAVGKRSFSTGAARIDAAGRLPGWLGKDLTLGVGLAAGQG